MSTHLSSERCQVKRLLVNINMQTEKILSSFKRVESQVLNEHGDNYVVSIGIISHVHQTGTSYQTWEEINMFRAQQIAYIDWYSYDMIA
jgi:hypothetical protein